MYKYILIAKERLHVESVHNEELWEDFMHRNYFSEFTPTVRPSCIPRFHPLELISFEGLFHYRTWDRLFFNEAYYSKIS
jgi:hypothetical protein